MKRAFLTFGILMFCSGCLISQDQTSPQLPEIDLALPALNTKAGNFSTCAEIVAWQRGKAAQWNYYNPPIVADAQVSAASQPTNVQERGLDEPDILKVDARSLFIARTQSVEIVNKDTLTLEQTLPVSDLRDIELGYSHGQLVIMGTSNALLFSPPGPYSYSHSFVVRTYARGNDQKFAPVKSVTLSGTLIGARLKDNLLTVVSKDDINWNDSLEAVGGKIRGVNCTSIQRPILDDFNTSLTYIHQVDVSDLSKVQSIARFGRTDSIYMGQKNLYLLGSGYNWFWRDPRANDSLPYDDLFVSQFSLDNGPRFAAAGKISGGIVDQFALNETADERLNVATTVRYGQVKNSLWTLKRADTDLEIGSVVSGFGPGEQMRSVRYFGNYAYIVTFRQTDPLFVFDLSGEIPQLIAQLDLPGFSSYLHPLADGRLLGVGYAQDRWQNQPSGVQVSVFNFTQPQAPTVIAQQKFGRQFSYADAVADHHAFYLDETSGLLALPVRLFKNSGADLEFSGAMVLNVNAPSASYGKITHWDWIPDGCRARQLTSRWWPGAPSMDVRRIMKVGSELVSLSPFGVRIIDPANGLLTSREMQFADGEAECDRLRSVYAMSSID